MSNADELIKLKELLESGLLTEEEFNLEKEKILKVNKNNSEKTEKEKKLEESPNNIKKSGNKFKEVDQNTPAKELNKSKAKKPKKTGRKSKWFISLFVLIMITGGIITGAINLAAWLPGSSGGLTDEQKEAIADRNNEIASSSSNSPLSACENWVKQTTKNANEASGSMARANIITSNLANGLISEDTFKYELNSELGVIQSLINSQNSSAMKTWVKGSVNLNSHTWFLKALEDTYDGYYLMYSGVLNGSTSQINQGTQKILSANANYARATDSLNSC